MIARFAITLLIIGVGFAAYTVGTRWQTRHVAQSDSRVLRGLRKGIPAVIYFWSEACTPCKMVQSPALKQLESALGPDAVQVVSINAVEQRELAHKWGVMGLPTTFIVDRSGEPRHVNHGVTRFEQLQQQIAVLR